MFGGYGCPLRHSRFCDLKSGSRYFVRYLSLVRRNALRVGLSTLRPY